MDVIAAYRDVGTYRGAAAICGTTHKTVKRIIEAHEVGRGARRRRSRRGPATTTRSPTWSRSGSRTTAGRITAKRLLPAAMAAGYDGSARNFRRLVADAKRAWRAEHPRGRRPGVWAPGETLIIDWGVLDGVHVFCAVLAWSRFRFVRFAADEKAATTLAMLAECFEVLGGVPKVVLADRMGCLKGGVVANVVVPTPDYVRFATHYRFRPDFCEAADPESKGMVENLVGYAKSRPDGPAIRAPSRRTVDWAANAAADGVVRRGQRHDPFGDLRGPRAAAGHRAWSCSLTLPSLRAEFGARPTTRKVDKLSCIRFGSARYSVPNRLIGTTVTVLVDDQMLRVHRAAHRARSSPSTPWSPPGETSIVDDHYGGPRPEQATPCGTAQNPSREGVPRLGTGRRSVLDRGRRGRGDQAGTGDRRDPHPGRRPRHRLVAGRARAGRGVRPVAGRRRPFDPGHERSGAARPAASAGQALVLTLPTVPTRSLEAYRIDGGDAS